MRHRTPADTGGWYHTRGLVQGSSAASCLWALTVYVCNLCNCTYEFASSTAQGGGGSFRIGNL